MGSVHTKEQFKIALQQNDLETLRKLTQKGNTVHNTLEFDTDGRLTALQYASKQGLGQALAELLAHGADVNNVDDIHGRTPLSFAAEMGRTEVAGMLCARGADVNKADCYGRTPLSYASWMGHVDVVRVLCKHGVNVTISRSALMDACRSHHVNVVEELLKNNNDVASLHQRDSNGNTLLHIACHSYTEVFTHPETLWGQLTPHCQLPSYQRRGHPGMVRLLLNQHHCECDVKNRRHETALQHTIMGIKKLLYCQNTSWSAEEAAKFLQILQMLIKAGCSLGSSGEHPLTSMLESMKTVVHRFLGHDKNLPAMFCECIMVLLSSGCFVGEVDFQLMNSDIVRPAMTTWGVHKYAAYTCARPTSLKRLCKLAVRRTTRKPLTAHLPSMGLPQILQKYILLEITDSIP